MLKLNRLARDASFLGCLRNVVQHLRCMLFDMFSMLREGFGHLPYLRFRNAEHIERRLDDQRGCLGASYFASDNPCETAFSASCDPSVAINILLYMSLLLRFVARLVAS